MRGHFPTCLSQRWSARQRFFGAHGLVFAGVLTLASRAAAADERAANAAAEALFQEGRALLVAGKPAEACLKLEESHRLDPATGTLMALGLCREQEGRLASAWAAFVETEGRSRLAGRADRERMAHEHAVALRPRLSTLNLRVPSQLTIVAGLLIVLDGVTLGRGGWNSAIPVDGGPHIVEARIDGRRVWRANVKIQAERDHLSLDVQVDHDARDAEAAPVAAKEEEGPVARRPVASDDSAAQGAGLRETPAPSGPDERDRPLGARRIAAIATASVGLVAAGASVLVIMNAKHDYDRATAACNGRVCPPGPYDDATNARWRGDVATVVALIGGAALVSSAALWLFAPPESAPAATARGARVDRISVGLGGASIGGASIGGHF